MKGKIFFVVMLFLLSATMAMGIEQATEAKADIPFANSTEYKGATIIFLVTWEGNPAYRAMIEATADHFVFENPRYYSVPVEEFFRNRTTLEDNFSQYLAGKLGRFGIKITGVSLRNFQLYPKDNFQNVQRQCNNRNVPEVIYRESPLNPYGYLVAFLIGVIFAYIMFFYGTKD